MGVRQELAVGEQDQGKAEQRRKASEHLPTDPSHCGEPDWASMVHLRVCSNEKSGKAMR